MKKKPPRKNPTPKRIPTPQPLFREQTTTVRLPIELDPVIKLLTDLTKATHEIRDLLRGAEVERIPIGSEPFFGTAVVAEATISEPNQTTPLKRKRNRSETGKTPKKEKKTKKGKEFVVEPEPSQGEGLLSDLQNASMPHFQLTGTDF